MFFFLYLTGIVSTFATLPNWKGAEIYGNAPWELFLDVYIITAIATLIRKHVPRVIAKAIIYAFIYPLYIIDTFCFVKFGATLNPSMLLLLGETNANEASEFLTSYVNTDVIFSEVGWFLLIPLVHLLTIAACHWLPRKVKAVAQTMEKCTSAIHALQARKRMYMALCTAGNIAVLILIGVSWGDSYINKELYHRTMTCETIGEVEHSLAIHPRTEMYQPPMRLAFSIYSNQLIAKQLDRLYTHTGNVQVDTCTVKSPNIVLIIGESCNKRHFQLYGYDKCNTPKQVKLEKSGLLTKFDDVVSPWNLTSFVFKHLMTTYCVGDSMEWCDYPLFCEIFRKAGYRVSFFTNQFQTSAKDAVYDFSGGFFINDPELSKVQFDIRNEETHVFDEGLLSDYEHLTPPDVPLADAGAAPQGKLTIFHLMGQHVNYRIRCPNSKKRWGANDYPNDMDMPEKKRKVMADYDNAVWYNDSVVNQIIERFRKEDAIVIYLSDHGEEVFGPGARHFFGRMHDATVTKRLADEEFRIPMWIYTSPRYRHRHTDVVKAIKQAHDKPYMSDALSHLLMGLAGIQCPYYRPQYDLLSDQYDAKRKRILKHTTDYDILK